MPLFPASSLFAHYHQPIQIALATSIILSLACVAWASCGGR